MALAKPLVVTAGEPAGIGPELCAALSASPYADDLVIIGDRQLLGRELRVIDTPFPVPVVSGKPDSANAQTLIDGLTRAVNGCLDGEFSGLVTAPLSKSVIADAGIPFTGHTELLAELTNARLPVMLLVADQLRVALASTHLPLSEVPGYITAERLRLVIEILESELRAKFKITHPDIVVCGLNPHAGEGGHLGHEDRDIIA
ncbi:MAG: 4-hydroxythreonine-4-phosphate dehydrogenase PdxA, partial [Woeseiaceae bacterium]